MEKKIPRKARVAGAAAVVEVRMRTLRHRGGTSLDFTLLGTAVKLEGLAANPHPVIATVGGGIIRLIEADVVPVGVAVGARYE